MRFAGTEMHWGMPTSAFGQALAWTSEASAMRRRDGKFATIQEDQSICSVRYPSWSWTGWIIESSEISMPIYGEDPKDAPVQFYSLWSDNSIRRISSGLDEAPQDASRFEVPSLLQGQTKPTESKLPLPQAVHDTGQLIFWTYHVSITINDTSDWLSLFRRYSLTKTMEQSKALNFPGWLWRNPEPRCLDCILITRTKFLERNEWQVMLIEWIEPEAGIARRIGIATLKDDKWNKLGPKTWRQIILE
jgi:hypothetical protein